MLRRRALLTFLALAAGTLLALDTPGTGAAHPELRRIVRLAAAAEIPVPQPLPVEAVEAAAAPVTTRAGDKAIAPAPDRFVGAAPTRLAPPPQLFASSTPGGLQSGTWAVVIGVNDYPGTEYDLRYAANDASDTVQALLHQGVAGDHILSLRDGQVTASVIRSAVAWLTSHAGPDAVAVFFFAGHVKKVGMSEALVGADGSWITDNQLAGAFQSLAARRAWITIAACYGGGFTELLAPGRVLTAAAGPNDVAYESSEFGRSYLVEFMIRRAMIQGAASQTVQTAYAWAQAEINRQYANRSPVEYDYSDGRLDLRPPGAPSYQYQQPYQSYGSPPPQQQQQDSSAPPSESSPPPDDGTDSHCRGIICFG